MRSVQALVVGFIGGTGRLPGLVFIGLWLGLRLFWLGGRFICIFSGFFVAGAGGFFVAGAAGGLFVAGAAGGLFVAGAVGGR